MKKLMVMVLSAVLLLGTAGMLSVSALGTNEGYPYLFETYETQESLDAIHLEHPDHADVSVVSGGANGSGGSLQVLQNNAGYFDIGYPVTDLQPQKGQKIKLSVWVKLNSDIVETYNDKKCNVVSFIFRGKGTVTNAGTRTDVTVGDYYDGSGWKQYDVTDLLVKDQWVKVTKEIAWEDAMSIGSGASIDNIELTQIDIRVSSEAGINALVDPDEAVLDYQIDDFNMEFSDEAGVNIGTTGTYVVNNDFDTSTVTGELDGRSEDCSPAYRQVVSNVITDDKGTHGDKFADVTFSSAYLKMGHLYKVSGWFRYDGVEGDAKLYGNSAKIRQILYAGTRDKEDKFSVTSSYPSVYPATIKQGEWTKVEYYYYYEYKAYDNHNFHVGFRICPEKLNAEGQPSGSYATDDPSGAGTFSFDKLQIFDLGVVGNGDMELDTSLPVFYNFNEVEQTVPGWNPANAMVELVSDTPSGTGYSLKLTSTGQYGTVKTSANFEQGKLYRISFKAKTENLGEGETLPLVLIFDRKAAADNTPGATEIYNVPNYQYMVGEEKVVSSGEVAANQEWTLSNEWQEYTGWYYVNFPRIEGKEDADDTYIVPRRPSLYLYVNGDSPVGTVLYIDDFKVEEMTNSNILEDMKNGLDAEVTGISATGTAVPGSKISVSYTYVPKYSETEDKTKTLIKAYSVLEDGNVRNYGAFSPSETFTVPACAAGQDITFEIIPISTAGLIGHHATYTVNAGTDYVLYDAAAKKVTAAYSGVSAKLIYASYKDGRLTSFAVSDASFVDGLYTETAPAAFTPGADDVVKVMLWKDLENCAPICSYAQ